MQTIGQSTTLPPSSQHETWISYPIFNINKISGSSTKDIETSYCKGVLGKTIVSKGQYDVQ